MSEEPIEVSFDKPLEVSLDNEVLEVDLNDQGIHQRPQRRLYIDNASLPVQRPLARVVQEVDEFEYYEDYPDDTNKSFRLRLAEFSKDTAGQVLIAIVFGLLLALFIFFLSGLTTDGGSTASQGLTSP